MEKAGSPVLSKVWIAIAISIALSAPAMAGGTYQCFYPTTSTCVPTNDACTSGEYAPGCSGCAGTYGCVPEYNIYTGVAALLVAISIPFVIRKLKPITPPKMESKARKAKTGKHK